jgi:predicted short-subunit dehydrogenase-like oxidoreductase (DUF2520 family)
MKPALIGLVGAGYLSRSFVARLPALPERLGPVLAPTYRLSSRLVNALRAGHPVERYEELEEAHLLLIAVPDGMLGQVVEGLADGVPDWKGKFVLLCESSEDCTMLAPLVARGAAAASVNPIPGLNQRFVVEGDRKAVREARNLLGHSAAQIFEIPCGTKAVYRAALTFSSFLLPVAEATSRCLRATGMAAAASNSLLEQLLERALRAYLHGGRKAWSGVLAEADERETARQLDALRRLDPALARAYEQLARFALERFERDVSWLERILTGTAPRRGARSVAHSCKTAPDHGQ